MSTSDETIIKLQAKAAALRTAQQARDWENIKRLSEEVLTLATFLHELAAGVIENTPKQKQLELGPEPAKRTRLRNGNLYPRGDQKAYFVPLVENMKPGDVVVIPVTKWPVENLRGGVGAWCARHWGVHSTVTRCRRRVDGTVEGIEVLRQK